LPLSLCAQAVKTEVICDAALTQVARLVPLEIIKDPKYGKTIVLNSWAAAALDTPLNFPKVRYSPPPPSQNHEIREDRLLEEDLNQINELTGLGLKPEHYFSSGGFRHVYEHPTEKGKLVKIYNWLDIRSVYIARMIQRELALYEFLKAKGLSVSPIDMNPEYLRRGIIITDQQDGAPLGQKSDRYNMGKNPKLDKKVQAVLSVVDEYDNTIRRIMSEYLDIRLGMYDNEGKVVKTGIDIGSYYSNLFRIFGTDEIVFIDW